LQGQKCENFAVTLNRPRLETEPARTYWKCLWWNFVATIRDVDRTVQSHRTVLL